MRCRVNSRPTINAPAKNNDRVFAEKTDAGDRAEDQPQFRILRFDETQDYIRENAPQQRFKTVYRELMIDDPPNAGRCSKRRSENGPKAAGAELTRKRSSEDDASCARQCGPEE